MPFLTAEAWHGPHALRTVDLEAETLQGFDCVVITTDHSGFDYAMIVEHGRSVVDTRNAIGRALKGAQPDVVRLGAAGTVPPTAVAA